MPGTNDRDPSDADRAPASRVGQKLQEIADDPARTGDNADAADIEEQAYAEAEREGWDQAQTAREGGS